MNVSELITSKEYPCEDHYVTTFDGYILSLQRIPFGNVQNKTTGGRPVVFLQHGLLGDGTNWVTNLVNQSFAFILADAGYDVWIGNLRGTTYSKKHVNLSPKRRQFWKWSWDEMAKYDVPAMINYALKISRQSQLYYIGHSQGTTVGFASFSSNADIAKKVKLFIAFGPVTTTEHISSPIRIFSDSYLYKPIEDVLKLLNLHEFLPTGEFFDFLARVCAYEKLGILCESVLFMLEGYDCHRMNTSRIPIYLGHTPAGTSLQNIVHWMQMIQSGKFQMYNYGLIENLVHYKQIRPPVYDVGAMETPVALYWGEWDMLADPLDVELLIPKLKNIVVKRKLERFDHFDFVWAMDAIYVLYNDVIKLMQQY
ncbi:gastric triacylglycerol lipase-like [Saccoglossus kowalevskii]